MIVFPYHQLSAKPTHRLSTDSVLTHLYSVVRLLDFHNRSSKIIVQEFSIDDRL